MYVLSLYVKTSTNMPDQFSQNLYFRSESIQELKNVTPNMTGTPYFVKCLFLIKRIVGFIQDPNHTIGLKGAHYHSMKNCTTLKCKLVQVLRLGSVRTEGDVSHPC